MMIHKLVHLHRYVVSIATILVALMNIAHASQHGSNVFWSGHSLTDPPIPQMLASLSGGYGAPMQWNRHSMAGGSLEARTRGRPPNMNGWDGYQQGNNRDTSDMDVAQELLTGASIGDERYDVLIITEVHDFLWSMQFGDSVRLLRHYHEQFRAGNATGQTYFYQAWLDVYDKDNPQAWIEYERAAAPIWQCIANRVNLSLEAEKRGDRILFIPAGDALTVLVEEALSDNGVPGISAATTRATLDTLFRDYVHLTDTGAYFIALLSYAFINGNLPPGAWVPEDMSRATANALQNIARQYHEDFLTWNTALSMDECSARVRDSFAAQYWPFAEARKINFDLPWYEKLWERATVSRRVEQNIAQSISIFADDNPDNPLRYDPGNDIEWHPPLSRSR